MAAEHEKLGKKKGGMRNKWPMELIKNPKQRHVAFSKRKKGLLGKCAALCSLFSGNVEIAAVVFSQTGKAFSFGHPSPDGVLHRYLNLQDGCNSGDTHNTKATKTTACSDSRDTQNTTATGSDSGDVGFWWVNTNVDEMNLEELKLFKPSLEELRKRVFDKVIDLEFGGSEIKSGEPIDNSDDLVDGLVVESVSDNRQEQHYDDMVSSDYLGFESISNNQQQQCHQYLRDGGLLDIFYDIN